MIPPGRSLQHPAPRPDATTVAAREAGAAGHAVPARVPGAARTFRAGGLAPAVLAALTLALSAVVSPLPARAEQPPPVDDFAPFDDASLEARYRELIGKLRCLVCQNESLADSHASLAADLRREVRGMLEAGRVDAEILAFLIERYGDFVLYDPPLDARTAVLWAGPPLLLMLAAGWLGLTLARRARHATPARPLDADARAAVARALDEET